MNKLISAVQNRDGATLAHIASGAQREQVVNDNAVKLVDALFDNLIRLFPAARHTVLATADDVSAMKRQWILGFAEGGITTVDQVRAGVRRARLEDSDFWPSCGKFIGWCRESVRADADLPSDEQVVAEFHRYARESYRYATPEDFPWTHDVMYWVVLDVRHLMHQHNYTDAEVLRSIKSHMRKWERELEAGREIPKPVMQLADKRRPPAAADIIDPAGSAAFRQAGEALLARIRARQQGTN